jgi:hypothetical protein
VLSAIPWITDSTTVQNIVIIAIVSNITSQIQLQRSQTLQIHSKKQSGNESPSSSRAIGRHVGSSLEILLNDLYLKTCTFEYAAP